MFALHQLPRSTILRTQGMAQQQIRRAERAGKRPDRGSMGMPRPSQGMRGSNRPPENGGVIPSSSALSEKMRRPSLTHNTVDALEVALVKLKASLATDSTPEEAQILLRAIKYIRDVIAHKRATEGGAES